MSQRGGRFPVSSSRDDALQLQPEGQWMDFENYEEGGTSITADLTQNDRAVHVDFFNEFDDVFDDEALD